MKKIKAALLGALPCLFLLGGCGGGSRGTGGQLYEGSVFDRSSNGIPGVSVTIVNTGDGSVTAADGHFSINTARVSGRVDFILEGPGFNVRSSVSDVPSNAIKLRINFIVGSGANPDVENDLEIEETDSGDDHGGSSDGEGDDSGSDDDGDSSGDDGLHDGGGSDSGGDSGHGGSDDHDSSDTGDDGDDGED